MTDTAQGYDKQPSVFELIDRYGIAIRKKACSCCGENLPYKIQYGDEKSFLVCARCDVEHSKRT